MDKKMSKLGKHGAEIRWGNYRKQLLEDLSKLCTKGELNFYQEVAKNDYSGALLREALMLKRKQKDEKRNHTL